VSNNQWRKLFRIIHLVASGLLGVFVYAEVEQFRPIIKFVVIPIIAITGLLMWQFTQIRKLFKGRETRE
jgi:hypothetical protein